jgi:hypothetical protein
MLLTRWLRDLRSACHNGRTGRRRPALRARPRLEPLEDRWLPSQIGLTVSSLADAGTGSLRAAVLTANAGSQKDQFTIGFAVKGTIDLQTPLPDLNNNISIQGPGAGSLTVERAAGASFASAVVAVAAGQTASLSGLTIAKGNDGGIFNDNGTLTVSGCTISGNSSTVGGFPLLGYGGGILNFGSLTVSGCTISRNSALRGGGILNASTMTVSGCTISGNSASGDGGGIVNLDALTVSGCTVSGNSATAGGGISNDNGGAKQALTVSGSTVCGNSATVGGGIFNRPFGTLLVSNNSTLSGNTASDGGGLWNDGAATLQDSTLSGNTATEGGGIYNQFSGTLTVQGSTLTGNTAGDSGGGLYNLGTATLQGSTLSGNTATEGGGIFNGASATLAVKDSTVLGNTAPGGADLYNIGALTLDDSTVGVIGP